MCCLVKSIIWHLSFPLLYRISGAAVRAIMFSCSESFMSPETFICVCKESGFVDFRLHPKFCNRISTKWCLKKFKDRNFWDWNRTNLLCTVIILNIYWQLLRRALRNIFTWSFPVLSLPFTQGLSCDFIFKLKRWFFFTSTRLLLHPFSLTSPTTHKETDLR